MLTHTLKKKRKKKKKKRRRNNTNNPAKTKNIKQTSHHKVENYAVSIKIHMHITACM